MSFRDRYKSCKVAINYCQKYGTFCRVGRRSSKVYGRICREGPVCSRVGRPTERARWRRANHFVVLEVAQNSVDRRDLETSFIAGRRSAILTEGMLSVLQTFSVISLSRISQAKMEGHSRCYQCSKLVIDLVQIQKR